MEKTEITHTTKEQLKAGFEQKYIDQLKQEYQRILSSFSPDNRQQKEQAVDGVFEAISTRLTQQPDFTFSDRQQTILKLKLARHFEHNNTCYVNVLFDAIIESPKFINTDRGSIHRLFEVHEEKTLQKIAEIRKQRSEMGDTEVFNPYENLFTTKSGKYYMARLLNMPHLADESQYMNHCVGTSDSYVNRMKRGEIEIFSFRHVPKINSRTQKLEGDTPVITIEYNLKTKVIEQMKKNNDDYLTPEDPFYDDVVDALKQLRTIRSDSGELRDFKNISASELENIPVDDYHILTENGQVSFRDFNPDNGPFILKMGDMQILPSLSRQDATKILRIVAGIKCKPEDIALTKEEISKYTHVYIGQLFPGFFDGPASGIEHVYSRFPGGEIIRQNLEIGGKTSQQLEAEMKGEGINVSEHAQDMLRSKDFITLKSPEKIRIIRLKVRDLGFENGATTQEIYDKAEKLGLDLCPAEVGPNLRLKYTSQPLGEWFRIAMKQIAGRGDYPGVFGLGRGEDGLWLNYRWAYPDYRWRPEDGFVFCLRKLES